MTAAAPGRRERPGLRRHLNRLLACGLADPLREIALSHGATLGEVYLDSREPGAVAARLESWWWLTSATCRSAGEVAWLYGRERGSVVHALRRLGTLAAARGVLVAGDTVSALAAAAAGATVSRVGAADEDLAALLRAAGAGWPEPFEGVPFARAVSVETRQQYEDFHYLSPRPPSRTVPAETVEDDEGEEVVLSWRLLTDEEWAEAEEAYRRALERHERTGGYERRKVGPAVTSATFVRADGARVSGRWVRGRGWHWDLVEGYSR